MTLQVGALALAFHCPAAKMSESWSPATNRLMTIFGLIGAFRAPWAGRRFRQWKQTDTGVSRGRRRRTAERIADFASVSEGVVQLDYSRS